MAEYITKEFALSCVDSFLSKTGMPIAAQYFYDCFRECEVSDVQPVKHGYWIKQPEKFQIHEDVINSNYLYSCSCCNASDLHSERANNDGEVKFCWRCGARMDGDVE